MWLLVNYLCIGPIGSRHDFITFTRYPKIRAVTGWFYGTLEEFIDAVKETHNNNEHMENYMRVVEFIKGMWV